ncbi:unnamed protein product, partial [Ectocarpus fasciculatus]
MSHSFSCRHKPFEQTSSATGVWHKGGLPAFTQNAPKTQHPPNLFQERATCQIASKTENTPDPNRRRQLDFLLKAERFCRSARWGNSTTLARIVRHSKIHPAVFHPHVVQGSHSHQNRIQTRDTIRTAENWGRVRHLPRWVPIVKLLKNTHIPDTQRITSKHNTNQDQYV